MAHVCMTGPCASGHLNPMAALGCELKRRGHRVTYVGHVDARPIIEGAGLELRTLGEKAFPEGTTKRFFDRLGTMSGLAAARYTFSLFEQVTEVYLNEAPPTIEAVGPDVLLVDPVLRSSGSIGERLRIPFVTVCCILPARPEPTIPPFGTAWPYQNSLFARLRNRVAYGFLSFALRKILRKINGRRAKWKLPPLSNVWASWSPLAVLCQSPASFDFPRKTLPPHFHYLGPFYDDESRAPVAFPFEALTNAPLVYASLGTVMGRLHHVLRTIAKACADLPVQLVITRGGAKGSVREDLPGSPLVVDYAPQMALLERAALTITHAGLNTALESLRCGVPMVAIPISNDQPGVAARIAWTGTGEVVPLAKLSPERLAKSVRLVLDEERFRRRTEELKEEIRLAGGVQRAADIVERVLETGKAVRSDE